MQKELLQKNMIEKQNEIENEEISNISLNANYSNIGPYNYSFMPESSNSFQLDLNLSNSLEKSNKEIKNSEDTQSNQTTNNKYYNEIAKNTESQEEAILTFIKNYAKIKIPECFNFQYRMDFDIYKRNSKNDR